MGHRARGLVLPLIVFFGPALALAQPTVGPPTATAPAPPPPPAAPSPAASGSAAPVRPATGYGWGDPKQGKAPAAPRIVRRNSPAVPDAVLPGFEGRPDGSSRLFVRLTKKVTVEEKKAAGSITYVLKGVEVPVWNNRNALVTVHFNTPVTRARLVPRGRDVLFIVELRANVAPTWKVDEQDGAAVLAIDFPRGDFLPAEAPYGFGTPAEARPAASNSR